MLQLNAEKLLWRMPDVVHEFLDLELIQPHRGDVWLAGGALRTLVDRSTGVEDFDVFFGNDEARAVTAAKLESTGAVSVFNCPEGKLQTFKVQRTAGAAGDAEKLKIQLITPQFYKDAETLLSTFDINACRFAYDGEVITTYREAIRDVRRKEITLNAVTYPNATFRRILKYQAKGYRVMNDAIAAFVTQVYADGVAMNTLNQEMYID